MDLVPVKNFDLPALEGWVESIGERSFRARQLYRHLYVRKVRRWEECTDLSKSFRSRLEHGALLHSLEIFERLEASDGTVKYLFELADGLHIESVLIPDPPRATLCVSSQVGCALGCSFCLTGSMGFKRNLETAEIVDQVCRVQQDSGNKTAVTNIVFMGMGEPLANYDSVARALGILSDPGGMGFSHRRVTVSTAGLPPAMRRLGRETPVNLAVSLHAPENDIRSRLMPVNRTYPLEELVTACREYPVPHRKRITFEYLLIDGVNDDPRHARRLAKLLHSIPSKVNLIPSNGGPDSAFPPPPEKRVLEFQEILKAARLTATIRKSRGAEIGAACGQLAARRREERAS